jgi:complement component 1 Q subcomponent-binding protein
VFVVENVSYYNDGKLATDLTPEADWKRRGLYIGPQVRPRHFFCRFVEARVLRCIYLNLCQFETLDLNFQEEFEKFLQERGINEGLAFFVPEYAQHKEQKV